MHWRFRVLKDDFPTGETLTEEAVGEWCLRVHQAVFGLVGGSEPCEDMQYVRQRMAFSVDIQPKRRLRERELFGDLRAMTRLALNGAALLEQEDETDMRVVDLHPWVAEPAERLFDGGHYRQAILAAAQNLLGFRILATCSTAYPLPPRHRQVLGAIAPGCFGSNIADCTAPPPL